MFSFALVYQSQQSNHLPNGTLFQVKVAYIYTPVHDDELTIKPNDIINVTRLVCSLDSLRIFQLTSDVFRWKKAGTKERWMGNWVYFHRTMSHESSKKQVGAVDINEGPPFLSYCSAGSKKDPLTKRKPANGLSALINKEVRGVRWACLSRTFRSFRFRNLFRPHLWKFLRHNRNLQQRRRP